jgi:hypothetical protein
MIFKKRDNFENEEGKEGEQTQVQTEQVQEQQVEQTTTQAQEQENVEETQQPKLTPSELIQKEMDIEEKKRHLTSEFITFQNEIDKAIKAEQDTDKKNFFREQKKQMLQKYRDEMSLLK